MLPTLVFLPGTLCNALAWRDVRALIGSALPCVTVDYRDCNSIGAMARRVADAVAGPVVPVGLSMGGIVAFELWRQASARIPAMALFGVNPGPDLPERHVRRRMQIEAAERDGIAAMARAELAPAYFAPGNPQRKALVEVVAGMAGDHGVAAFAAQSQALATRPDSWPLLGEIRVPVLVAWGEHDRVCPPELQQRLVAGLPQAEAAALPDCGHLAPLEAPVAAADALRRWLERTGLVAAGRRSA